jgi:hypothetical protein
LLLHEGVASRARANNDSREALKLLKQRRLCRCGEACIGRTAFLDFAHDVFHGEKRFAEMAQHFEIAQQKCVQRFAVFDRSAVSPLRSPSPPNRAGFASLAYVAGIHVFTACVKAKTWMAGTSPAMTVGEACRHVHSSRSAVLSRSRTAPNIVIDQGKHDEQR